MYAFIHAFRNVKFILSLFLKYFETKFFIF